MNVITFFFFSSRRRHTRSLCDWSSDVCSSDLLLSPSAPANCAPPLRRASDHLDEVMNQWCLRSEERRVGKECRSRWSRYHEKKKNREVGHVCYTKVAERSK